jgi:hypothetical protein
MKCDWLTAGVLVLLATVVTVEADEPTGLTEALPVSNPRDVTFLVEEEPVQLRNGYAVHPVAPGSASLIRTQLSGAPVYADIDGDGDSDALFFLVRDSGGSGTFYYVVAALKVDDGYRGGKAVFIGDRIAPQRLDVLQGVVVVDYLEHAPAQPLAAQPALPRTAWFVAEGDLLIRIGTLEPGEQIIEGWVRFGHEVRSFEPCAHPQPYWLRGDSPALDAIKASLGEAGNGAGPWAPQLMVLAGSRSEPPAHGFGADYVAGWKATRVVRAVHGGTCRSDQVVLDQPPRDAVVASPLEIRGHARGAWFFEGDFPVVLLDSSGKPLAQGFASAQGEWMTTGFVPFSAVLHFEAPGPGHGRLLLKKDNPSDRRELDDMLVVPVVFR